MKTVECSLLQREPAAMSVCGGDDGGGDRLKREQKQNRRWIRRDGRKNVNRGAGSEEATAARQTDKGDE